MLRIKLVIVIAVMLIIVFILTLMLFWGAKRVTYYSERSHLAHNSAMAYLQLSHNAHRHFNKLMEVLVLEDSSLRLEEVEASYQTLAQSLKYARLTTDAEIDFTSESETEHEHMEHEQITNMEQTLNQGINSFKRIMSLQQGVAKIQAQRELSKMLAQAIDLKFKPIIEASVAEELEEASQAQQLTRKLRADLERVASLTAIAALLLSLIMAVWLWRSLSTPLFQLMMGVRQIAKGNLHHRIQLPGRNEFTYLAKNFNQMTDALATQRQQLQSAHESLEQQVVLRTNELQQAYYRLQQIDNGRRRFFADISHELRTPLTALRGDAEVTLRGKDKPAEEYRAALGRVVKLSEHMNKLVDDLLFMARSEATEFSYEFQPLMLIDFVVNLLEDAQALVYNRQQQLILDLPEYTINIKADPQRMRQLMLIIIDNACRYSDPGGKITLSLKQCNDHAILVVSDHGIGIPEHELESVFVRLFRGDKARSRVPSGSGLGLPLAKSITEAHNGNITLRSKPGEGTQVTITLPVIS